MKKITLLFISAFFFSLLSFAQNSEVVEVKGVGFGSDSKKARQDAIDDALRMAVARVVGTHVTSKTSVKNAVTLEDAIATRSKGYVRNYEVLSETPLNNKYEVTIKADVSLEPVIEDAKVLAEMIGGVNFIVIYDPRDFTEQEKWIYDYAYERMNEKLNDKGYERTEARLYNEAVSFANTTNNINYLSTVGLYTNSEFIIQIKEIHFKVEDKQGGLKSAQVTMDMKTYDNCNFRNLGSVEFKGDWKIRKDEKFAIRDAVSDAIDLWFDRLMLQFNNDIGKWVTSGAPYEVRFYGFTVTDDDFYDYADLIIDDPDNVGDPDVVGVGDYYRIVFRSKKSTFKFGRLSYKKAKEVDGLKTQVPTTRIKYKRQFSLTPRDTIPPEIKEKMEKLKRLGWQ